MAHRIDKTPAAATTPSTHLVTHEPEHQNVLATDFISTAVIDATRNHNIPVRGDNHRFPPVIPLAQLHDDRTGVSKCQVRDSIPVISKDQCEQIVSIRGIARNNDLAVSLLGQSTTVVVSIATIIDNHAIGAETAVQCSVWVIS